MANLSYNIEEAVRRSMLDSGDNETKVKYLNNII